MHLLRCNYILAQTKECNKFCKNYNRERKKKIKNSAAHKQLQINVGLIIKVFPMA